MKIALDWTLENRSPALNVRVAAEVRRQVCRSGVDVELEDIEAADPWSRPVRLTPEEEREVETALLQEAEMVEWCVVCGREPIDRDGDTCIDCLHGTRTEAWL